MRLDEIQINPESLEEGRWYDLPGGGRIKVGSIQSRKYQNALNRFMKPYLRLQRAGNLDPEIRDKITGQALAEIIFDWEGIEDTGAAVPFSRETARKLLTDRRYLKFMDLVATLAAEDIEDDEDALQDAEGNSPPG